MVIRNRKTNVLRKKNHRLLAKTTAKRTSTDFGSWSRVTKSRLLDLRLHAGDGITLCRCLDNSVTSPTDGITLAGVVSFEGGYRSMASALYLADRQFPEFAELQPSDLQLSELSACAPPRDLVSGQKDRCCSLPPCYSRQGRVLEHKLNKLAK